MKNLKTALKNPFEAPIFHIAETDSTMNDARVLAQNGAIDGTVIYTDFQSAGRGRIEGRQWNALRGQNLLCTTILKRPPVSAFTLRVGLSVSLTLDSFLPTNRQTKIKWPNDVLFDGKKMAGILCENDGSVLYIGTGINVAQTHFPGDLTEKATSLSAIYSELFAENPRLFQNIPTIEKVLLCFLSNLKKVLDMENWQESITDKLYRCGEQINFLSGHPDKKELINGRLEGIGKSGELLIRQNDTILHLYSGEIPSCTSPNTTV